MSVRTMARVWAESHHSGTHLLMLLAIADFADDDGNAYPSVPTLAQKCRMKPRNANVILAALKDSGELEVRLNEGPRGTNRYRIVSPIQGVQERTGGGVQISAGVQERTGVQSFASPPANLCFKPLQRIADKPSMNHQEPPRGALTARFELPDWIPAEAWNAWIEMRKSIKKPPTERAKGMALKKLEALRLDGQDPGAVLDQSTFKNWADLFPVKGQQAESRTQPQTGNLSADEQFMPDAEGVEP